MVGGGEQVYALDRTGHWQRRDENANKRQNSTKQKPISLGICILHARSPNKRTYLLSFSPFPNVKGFQCKASRFQPIRHKPAADALMPAFGSISSLPQVELLLPKSIPSGIALLVEVVQSLHYFLPRHSTGKGGCHCYGWGSLQPPIAQGTNFRTTSPKVAVGCCDLPRKPNSK